MDGGTNTSWVMRFEAMQRLASALVIAVTAFLGSRNIGEGAKGKT